ncbi:MAG: hypothetical protein U5L95_02590 [Candidatus Saccharibacteria bacterium]|nr:hypothetical protein [Candidatus Saccharibacteria bacterium]
MAIVTPDTEKRYEERLAEKQLRLERKSIIRDTFSIEEPLKQLESLPEESEPLISEQQVIVVQMPPQQPQQGVDWKSLISWAIAALNGVVLLLMNIKNLEKTRNNFLTTSLSDF